MKDRPSYNSLKESLRCANAEAQGYLERLQNVSEALLKSQTRELSAAKLCATMTEQNVQLQQLCWTLARALDKALTKESAA
jgi:hypothetical protein